MRQKMGRRYAWELIMLTILMSVGVCIVFSIHFRHNVLSEYQKTVYSSTKAIARLIDGERVLKYVDTLQTDELYERIDGRMRWLQKGFDLQYFYVCIPTETGMIYVWDTEGALGESLGEEEEYSNFETAQMMNKEIFRRDPIESLWEYDDPYYGPLITGASPIFDKNGDPVALVCADISVKEVKKTMWLVIVQVILSVVVALSVASIIYYFRVRKQLIEPINRLTEAASEIAEHLDKEDEYYHNKIYTGDELQTLSESFEKMDIQLRKIMSDNIRITAEKERMSAELNMAASIQDSQLPHRFPAFPDRDEFEIYADMKPAREVGGDFYDFYFIDESHLALVIADVSGKGIPAALFMMISRVLVKNRLQTGENPADVFFHVNNELMENNTESQFLTLWVGILDLVSGELVTVNAGHEYPIMRKAGERFCLIRDHHHPPLAFMEELTYSTETYQMHPGDTLFVYTDGVPEACDVAEEMYGTDRILRILDTKPDASPKSMIETVLSDVRNFTKGAEQFDDITMLALKYNGTKAAEGNG